MAAARRQKQAQKLQEQQMSKALAEAKPSTSHVSFDDDDDDIGNAQQTSSSSSGIVANTNIESDHEGSEDDDAPIEVVSNKTSRKQATQESAKLKAQEKAYVPGLLRPLSSRTIFKRKI